MKINTPYPEDSIRRIQRTQYAVFKIWNQYNILEDIKRGPYSKKSPIRHIQYMDTPCDMPRTFIPLRSILRVLQIGIKSQGYREPDTVMLDSEDSTVTYTAVSSPFKDGSDIGSPGVDGPPIMPEDP
ncbi:hypothetical protein Tco_0772574 [Tanacetum coccineum]|uniref:Uncharacterized protein n=1 Tax=Tanacetum coccineum TaxID=301880 RepID=A0ABQ4ZI95_9ASTR